MSDDQHKEAARIDPWIRQVLDDLRDLKQQVAALGAKISGDSEESHSWRLRDLQRNLDGLTQLDRYRSAQIEALERENGELRRMVDPIRQEVEDWKAWRNKILTAVVTAVVGLLVSAVGLGIWIALKVSVGGAVALGG